jgi:hypothetical protein
MPHTTPTTSVCRGGTKVTGKRAIISLPAKMMAAIDPSGRTQQGVDDQEVWTHHAGSDALCDPTRDPSPSRMISGCDLVYEPRHSKSRTGQPLHSDIAQMGSILGEYAAGLLES